MSIAGLLSQGWNTSALEIPSYAGSASNNWLPSRASYNCNPRTMHTVNAAMKKLANNQSPMTVLAIGHSYLVGYDGSGSAFGTVGYNSNTAIPRQFGKALASLLGVTYSEGFRAAIAGYGHSTGDIWTGTGGFTNALSLYGVAFTSVGAGTASWTSMDTGTNLEFLYLDISVNNFTYQIDGGAAVPVATGGTTQVGRVQVTGLANTQHTLTINIPSNYGFIHSARVYNPGNTLTVHNLAVGGSRIASAIAGASQQTWSDMTTLGLGYMLESILSNGFITPDLILLSCTDNDIGAGTPAANILAALNTFCNTVISNIPVYLLHEMLIIGSDPNVYNTVASGYYSLADTNNYFMFDMNHYDQGITTATNDGLIGPDGVHPSVGEQIGTAQRLAQIIYQGG